MCSGERMSGFECNITSQDHGTIPAAMMRHRKKELFEYGKCDESVGPGTGSKLY